VDEFRQLSLILLNDFRRGGFAKPAVSRVRYLWSGCNFYQAGSGLCSMHYLQSSQPVPLRLCHAPWKPVYPEYQICKIISIQSTSLEWGRRNGSRNVSILKSQIGGEPILETCMTNECTYDVKWALRPMVFGVTDDKEVHVYDLLLNERVEVLTLAHEATCRSLDWNKAE